MKLSSWRNLLILIAIVATLWAISQPMEAEAAPYDPEQTYLIPYDGDTLVIGTIDWLMAGYVCAEVQEGDTVILASSGGIVQAAYMITDCLRAKKVKVMVSHAYSIAPMIAFAGVEVCLSGAEDGIIGTHQPAYALEGLVMSDYDFAESILSSSMTSCSAVGLLELLMTLLSICIPPRIPLTIKIWRLSLKLSSQKCSVLNTRAYAKQLTAYTLLSPTRYWRGSALRAILN